MSDIILITSKKDYPSVAALMRDKNMFGGIIIFWECDEDITKINNIKEDCTVVIALENKEAALFVRELLSQMGISQERIVDFYRVYKLFAPVMTVDRVSQNPLVEKYGGIILGISHAEVGIIGEQLNPIAANLAVSSQDLYYNYFSLLYALEKYKDKYSDLKYIIIDMYKYNYFNFDLSRSKYINLYVLSGGINCDSHNYAENRNVTVPYEVLLQYCLKEHMQDVNESVIALWNHLFAFDFSKIDSNFFRNQPELYTRNKIITDEVVENYNYSPSNVIKRFEDTISENKEIFFAILETAKEMFPDIRIYVLQMPMYEAAWKKSAPYYEKWKTEFEEIIKEGMERVPFQYLDMTEHPISRDRICWYDTEHLNYYGAVRYTRILNDVLKEL